MRKAMELAVLCNAQVALVLFDDKGRLTQFSTGDMDALLEQYGAAVLEPHERYTPHEVRANAQACSGWGMGWRSAQRVPACVLCVRLLVCVSLAAPMDTVLAPHAAPG